MKPGELPDELRVTAGDTSREKGAKYQKLFILNPTNGLMDRVRKHQVQPQHTHYYDDATGEWYEVERG